MENQNHQLWKTKGSTKNSRGISGFAKTSIFK